MNKHIKAFLIKFIATFALLYIILGFIYGMAFGEVLLLSVVLGGIAYLVGDLYILPLTNNITGTLADFVFSGLIIYFFVDVMSGIENVFIASLLATIGVCLFEILFHRYVEMNVLPNENKRPANTNFKYQTEMSDELKVKKSDRDNKSDK